MPQVRFAVFVLLLAATGCLGRGTGGTDTMVRQEAPFPAILGPAVAGDGAAPVRYEVLRGDFHMHTIYSDGVLTPTERVLEAWRYGYDVIAITDHGNFRAYDEVVSMAGPLDLILLRGMETGLSGQEHLVALDFAAGYQPRSPHQWSETSGQARVVFYQDQWRTLAAAGGYVLYAHPHVGLREPMLWGIGEGLLQGIEVKNDVVGSGWNTVQSLGTWWYPFALDWAVDYNLTIFADSDVHGARANAEQAITLLIVQERSREGVMEALRARRTVAWFHGLLCGHRWVLELLMGSLVDVGLTETPDGRVFLCLQNRGPVPLTAQVADLPLLPVTLGAYQKVLVGFRGKPEAVTIAWKNLYLRSTENLTTTHILTPLARATGQSEMPMSAPLQRPDQSATTPGTE